jgi:hypothetical protein
MRATHGSNAKVMHFGDASDTYDAVMLTTDVDTRTLTLVLAESDWRALRDIEPDAVGWLQSQIRTRLAGNAPVPPAPRPAAEAFLEDEY